MLNTIVGAIVIFNGLLVVYHHLIFPLWMRQWKTKHQVSTTIIETNRHHHPSTNDDQRPHITLIIPAHNESAVIADKVFNLGTLDYPAGKLHIEIICDGCTDDTAERARQALAQVENNHLNLTITEYTKNRGKVAVINEAIERAQSPLIALSDVSAMISMNALLIAEQHFASDQVGVVAGTYHILNHGSEGEKLYWNYQLAIKQGEAALGAPMGAHGAFYMFRKSLFTPLPPDTINDDFILPMQIVAKGYRAIYDTEIMALELECASIDLDQHRRRRVAAGNLQQTIRLKHLLHPRHDYIALIFGSGKALRSIMPFCLLIMLLGSLWLAPTTWWWATLALSQVCVYALAAFIHQRPEWQQSSALKAIHYLVSGHWNGLVGGIHYISGRYHKLWQQSRQHR